MARQSLSRYGLGAGHVRLSAVSEMFQTGSWSIAQHLAPMRTTRLRRLVLSRADLRTGQAPPHCRMHGAQAHAPGRRLADLRDVLLVHLLKARAQALLQLRRAL